jgi:hypothetical protein
VTPAELATADLARRAWHILRRMRWENPDVTAARRAELDHELSMRTRRRGRERRAAAMADRTTTEQERVA